MSFADQFKMAAPDDPTVDVMPSPNDNHLKEAMRKLIVEAINALNHAESNPMNRVVALKQVEHVFAPDDYGVNEVLYLDIKMKPMTAYITITQDGPPEVHISVDW